MIVLEDVTKTTWINGRKKNVLSAVNIEIPSDRRIALLGPQQHKRMLIHLLGGVERPTTGRIARFADVSFPIGFLPGPSGALSTRANVAHVARLYAADVQRTLKLVEMILDIGPSFDRPYSELNAVNRRHLADIVPLCLPFHTYLLADDKLVQRWQAKKSGKRETIDTRIDALFSARFRNAGMIIPTADVDFARQRCDMSLVMHGDQLMFADGTNPRRQPKGRGAGEKTVRELQSKGG